MDDDIKKELQSAVFERLIQHLREREDVQNMIGERSEHLVNIFCTLNDRANTILYGRGLSNEDKTSLRWIEFCNIKDQDPEADILKEFEVVLTVNPKEDII